MHSFIHTFYIELSTTPANMLDGKGLRVNYRLSLEAYTYAYKTSKYNMTNDVQTYA